MILQMAAYFGGRPGDESADVRDLIEPRPGRVRLPRGFARLRPEQFGWQMACGLTAMWGRGSFLSSGALAGLEHR